MENLTAFQHKFIMRKGHFMKLKIRSPFFAILLFTIFIPVASNADIIKTFYDLNEFSTDLLNLQNDFNNQLADQGLYAYVGNTAYSDSNWSSFFSMGGTFFTDSTFGGFGVGIYFKDFTLPLTFIARYSSGDDSYTNFYTIQPNANNDPVFFGLTTDILLESFAVRTAYDFSTNSYLEIASYAQLFPWGYIRLADGSGPTTPVPEPTSMLIFGTGLVGYGLYNRLRSRRK
jgi:hypothetical protein